MAINITEKDGGIIFDVRVVPRASKCEIVGEHDGALKVRIASPPVDGAANAELIRFLAKSFRIPRGDVEIVGGESSKNKRVRMSNLTKAAFEKTIK